MNKREKGKKYEAIAAAYLAEHGYEIVEKNLFTPYGEIDIVARKQGTWAFCEVKYRSCGRFGNPMEAVDSRKQRKISLAALYYYARHGFCEEIPCRFDVIAVYGDGAVEHVKNAFLFQG